MGKTSAPRRRSRVAVQPVGELLPQRLFITLLGCYVRDDQRPVWAGGVVKLLESFGFSTAAARITLTRLVDRRLITRERAGRLVFYRPTARSSRLLQEGDKRIFHLGEPPPPDAPWTVLWYSLPKDARIERHRLSRRLRFLGFGPLEDSTWICPHDRVDDVCGVMEELGMASRGAVFRAHPDRLADLDTVIDRAWDLSGLAVRYEAFAESFSRFRDRGDDLTDAEAFRVRTLMADAFWQYPFADPDLPEHLLPVGWRRPEAIATFQDLFFTLKEPSQRHFDAVARPGALLSR